MVATAFAVQSIVNFTVGVVTVMRVLLVIRKIDAITITATTDCVWRRRKWLGKVAQR